MAAYAAVTSLMHILDALHKHHSPPISLDTQQVASLNEIAAFLQQFLEAYESPFGYSDEADPLEVRIINAAYAAEDVIESNIVKVIKKSTAYQEILQTAFQEETESNSDEEEDDSEVNLYEYIHQESDSIEEDDDSEEETKSNPIEEEDDSEVNLEDSCINLYEDLHQLIEEMDSIKKMAMEIDAAEKKVVPDVASRSSSTEQRHNTTMVCSDDVLLEILDKLVSGSLRRQVISITGMSGIGKTTLARTVCSKPLVKEYFDICVWVTISQKFNTWELLTELLYQATNNMRADLSEDDVGLALHRHLFGRRFLVVMDDMWSIDAWDQIQRFFPDNENGSRVLVTTRLLRLTSQLTSDYSLEMKFLDGVHSWELFSKTVFGEESCPRELEEIGKSIVHACKGLPLAIAVVGGILRKVEHTRKSWESIRRDLTSVVNLENDGDCLRLLKLSYNHLPAYLKTCFLYMGVFEEDEKIHVSTLINLWVSEGFLKPMNGESLETIARGFLKDLIDRNLLLIDGLTRRGNIKYCKIHDLVRDLCLREAHKYGFYDVTGKCCISQRRLVFRDRTSVLFGEFQSMPLARSIISKYGRTVLHHKFGLLRILHSHYVGEPASYKRYLNNALAFHCVNLRHIAGTVDYGDMSSFLSSLIPLWNLHTLIVDGNSDFKAPIGFWKMTQFRHIESRRYLYLPDPPNGKDDVVMENLQILKGVKDLKISEEVVKRCPNLKKLGIKYFNNRYPSLIDIERLSKLESLYISSYFPFHIHELTFPHSLKSLRLELLEDSTGLEDMLGRIGSLPLLQKLELWGRKFFGTGKWEIGEDQFPCLKYLLLSQCRGLKHWTAAQEGISIFPRLEHLHLIFIEELEKIPCEIGDVETLQKIELKYCSESVVMSVRDIVDEQVELQGEQDLSFHVEVWLSSDQEELGKSLAGHSNFQVQYY